MSISELHPIRELLNDSFSWYHGSSRHLVTVSLPKGSYGSFWYTTIDNPTPERPLAETVYTSEIAAREAHKALVESYRNHHRWTQTFSYDDIDENHFV